MAGKPVQSLKDLRGLSDAEWQEQLQTLRRDLWTARLKAREGSLQKVHQVGVMRRQIARLHTIREEQQRGQTIPQRGS